MIGKGVRRLIVCGLQAGGAAEADSGADFDRDLQPHNAADMRAFLNLSSFLVDLLPQCGADHFAR